MSEIRKVGRPKGSTKKPQNRNGMYVMNFEKQIEGGAITRDSSMGWVKFGLRNNWPNLLLDLYNQSPTHHAAVNFAVQCICGDGIDYEAMGLDGTQIFPNYQYSWDTLLRNIALDYILYGSYAIQIIRNKGGEDFSFYHIPYEKVRCSPYDEDGVITSYWISNDWTALGQNPPIEVEAIDMRDESEIKMGKPYLYVFKNYDPTMTFYQNPSYIAGIKAIQSEIQHILFDERSATNSFVPSGMLILNSVEDDNERKAILDNIRQMFVGSENASQVMVSFRSNIEEQAPSFVPFTANQGNVNLFDAANQRTVNRILSSHNIPSASLCGLPDLNNSGFSSEADKLETSYQLYQKLTGNYNRKNVVKSVNDMFKLNKIDVEIILKPLKFNDFGDENDVSTDVKSTDTTQDVSENNVEEKVEGN